MKSIAAISAFMLLNVLSFGQHKKVSINETPVHTATKSGPYRVELSKEIQYDPEAVEWKRSIKKIATYHNQPDSIALMKAAKALVKKVNASEFETPSDQSSSRSVTPELGTNFRGNRIPYATPPDNAFAISNGGWIVSSDNSTIEYYNENGQSLLLNMSHDDFYNDNSLNSGIFDPRLLYDAEADRFIFVMCHGSSANTSKILVAFSKTNNPQDGWWFYQLSGNPLNNNCWLDYPNIGISGHDLFVTGNLFVQNGGYSQAIVYQISKAEGYSGQTLEYDLFSDIRDSQNQLAFTLVPASYGQDGSYGPGIFLTSSRSGGGNRIYVYEITDDQGNGGDLNSYSTLVSHYEPAADATQPNSAPDLNNNDSRIQHCFYLNGKIHVVLHGDYDNSAYNGINYYRISVDQLGATEEAHFGELGIDYSFPSIASFGYDSADLAVMIGFLTVSSNSRPSIGAVNCDYNMEFSDPLVVKQGDTYIDYSWTGGTERWGDYSQMQRKHNAPTPEVWLAGCFGANSPVNHTWNTWISEIKGEYEPLPLPVALFTSDTTSAFAPAYITFTDTSLNDPTSRLWQFVGGSPVYSDVLSPVVYYSSPGVYDVKLNVENQFGEDSLLQVGYITIYEDTTIGIAEQETAGSVKVYPNPVKPYEMLYLHFEVPEYSKVQAEIFDINGRSVKTLVDDSLVAGMHRLGFNTLALSSGTYFVRISVNNEIVKNEKVIVD